MGSEMCIRDSVMHFVQVSLAGHQRLAQQELAQDATGGAPNQKQEPNQKQTKTKTRTRKPKIKTEKKKKKTQNQKAINRKIENRNQKREPCLEYLMQLVQVGLTGHQRLAQQELAQDAPGGPEVDRSAVRLATQQQLWTSVPQGHHLPRPRKRTNIAISTG